MQTWQCAGRRAWPLRIDGMTHDVENTYNVADPKRQPR